jgi:pimeloyl-ACP methyl ester carboxylesterase
MSVGCPCLGRALAVACAVFLALLALWATGSATAGPRFVEKVFSIDGQRAILRLPHGGGRGRLVLYVHGASGSAEAIDEAPVEALTEALLADGFAVAGDDAGGPQTWGDPESVAAYVRLADRLRFKQVVVLAQSMGGLAGVRLIDKLRPSAWVGIYPVCDARAAYENPELTPFVEEAWHGPPPAYLSPVRARHVRGLPVVIWASPQDTVVPFDENARVCAEEMRRGGASVRLIRTRGDHGDRSNFRPRELVGFLDAVTARRSSGPGRGKAQLHR